MSPTDIAAKLALIPQEREKLRAEADARMAELEKARSFAIGQFNFEMGRLAEREATLKEMLKPESVEADPALAAAVSSPTAS